MSFTIGCDPELICRVDGYFSPAHNHFRSASSMGLDGNTDVCEIRPGYSESPIDLTAKIRTILEYGYDKCPEIELYAGHYVDDYPIGGHIHFSVEPTEEIVSNLDTVLYSLSNCIDDKDQREQRNKYGYGSRKSYEEKHHGFEYRTPGSWLLSPATTLVTLTLAKLAVFAVTEDYIDFVELKGKQHSRKFLKNFVSYLQTIPPDCEEGLTELQLLLNMENINWEENILYNWGFSDISQSMEAA